MPLGLHRRHAEVKLLRCVGQSEEATVQVHHAFDLGSDPGVTAPTHWGWKRALELGARQDNDEIRSLGDAP